MIKKTAPFFLLLLLSACITLTQNADPKLLPTETLADSTCPICPTCSAPESSTTPATPTSTETEIVPPTAVGTVDPTTPIPPTASAVIVTPATSTPTPTVVITPTVVPYLYTIQPSNPIYSQNFNHAGLGCNWLGVAGQVFDNSGQPVPGLVVIVKGQIGATMISSVALTEHPDGQGYGPGGYEIVLGPKPVDSADALTIQLFDLEANALSAAIPFSTTNSCDQNLVIINFIANP